MKRAMALLAVGLLRMAGDAVGVWWMVGLGAATAASPAPRVFTTVGDMEPFSTRFYLEWDRPDGSTVDRELTPTVYARLAGPYNRRNAYGAVLAAGPALCADPLTRDLSRSVVEHALAAGSDVRRELGVADALEIRVRYEPVAGTMRSLPRRLIPGRCGARTPIGTAP